MGKRWNLSHLDLFVWWTVKKKKDKVNKMIIAVIVTAIDCSS